MENAGKAIEWNPKGGRPKLSQEERRDSVYKLRLTDKERADLEQQASEAGFKDVSVYVRKKLFSAGNAPAYNPKALFKAIDKTGVALKKIGTNINQIARYVHYLEQHNMVEGKVMAEYNQHFEELLKVEDKYVKAIRAFLRVTR